MSESFQITSPQKPAKLPVAVDAMGGDFGPAVVVQGAVQAARQLGISSILVGKEPILKERLRSLKALNESGITICHAEDEVTMNDSPSAAIRGKPNSSIRVAFELVKQGNASSVVSAGNTGAVMAAGLYVVGTLPGIARPAIASLIPNVGTATPTVLLDSGANVDCPAHQLVQFALMGHYYAKAAISSEAPRLALLSNGTEHSKGNDITRAAAMMLSEMSEVNFTGYVEGRDISRNVADVVVCDGFVGNIVLKAMEGSVELVFDSIKDYVKRSPRGFLGIWLTKPMFKKLFRNKLDPSAYGGAPLLGLGEIAIICHGSSNKRAIMNGIRVAQKISEEDLQMVMRSSLSQLDLEMPGVYEDGMWNRMGQKFEKHKGRNKLKRGNQTIEEPGGEPKAEITGESREVEGG